MKEIFTYEYYQKIVDRYRKYDYREINFQNRVVIPLLEDLVAKSENVWIVDVSLQGKNRNSKLHDISKYRSLEKHAASPDILVASNWNYKNRDNKSVVYHTVVEVKSPEIAPLFKSTKHTANQVRYHLKANKKVILTDCLRWEFYEEGRTMVSIELGKQNEEQEWIWKPRKEDDDIWEKLCMEIQTFINV